MAAMALALSIFDFLGQALWEARRKIWDLAGFAFWPIFYQRVSWLCVVVLWLTVVCFGCLCGPGQQLAQWACTSGRRVAALRISETSSSSYPHPYYYTDATRAHLISSWLCSKICCSKYFRRRNCFACWRHLRIGKNCWRWRPCLRSRSYGRSLGGCHRRSRSWIGGIWCTGWRRCSCFDRT